MRLKLGPKAREVLAPLLDLLVANTSFLFVKSGRFTKSLVENVKYLLCILEVIFVILAEACANKDLGRSCNSSRDITNKVSTSREVISVGLQLIAHFKKPVFDKRFFSVGQRSGFRKLR
jgi:hypothetical protein